MISFSEYARSRLALIAAARQEVDTILVERREFSKYARIILADETGTPYPLNVTPSLRMEILWNKKADDGDKTIKELRLIKDGAIHKTIPGTHIINRHKFLHWYVQASYCYYD